MKTTKWDRVFRASSLGFRVILIWTYAPAFVVHVWGQSVTPPTRKAESSAIKPATVGEVTFFEPNAATIKVGAVEYGLKEALVGLFESLESTNSEAKVQWLNGVSKFRTDLPIDVISRLIQAFKTERDSKVRQAILHTIKFSRDPRFADVCVSAQDDQDAFIRLMAGTTLIQQNKIVGVDIITRCLPELDERKQRIALAFIAQAIPQFGIDVKSMAGVKDLERLSDKELQAFVPQWISWWKENGKSVKPQKK